MMPFIYGRVTVSAARGRVGVCAASVSAVAKHRKSPGGSSEPIFKLIYSLVGMLIATAT